MTDLDTDTGRTDRAAPRSIADRVRAARPQRHPAADTAAGAHLPESIVAALATMQGWQRDLTDRMEDLTRSPILFSATVVLDAAGQWTRSWATQYRQVAVANLSGGQIVVASGPAESTAPGGGPGVHTLAAASGQSLGLAGHAVTIYGPPGGRVGVQILSRYIAPQFGSVTSTGATSTPLAALTAAGPTAVADLGAPRDTISVQTIVTGNPASIAGTVQGSLDGRAFFDLAPLAGTLTGELVGLTGKAVRYVRLNLTTLSGGSVAAIVASAR